MALTNSTSTLLPSPVPEQPNFSSCPYTGASTWAHIEGFRKKLTKPGPAISTLANIGSRAKSSTSLAARSRALACILPAVIMAKLVEKSPCSARLGTSMPQDFAAASGQ